MNSLSYREIAELERAYFSHLAEFFQRATGMDWKKFASTSSFGNAIKKHAHIIAPRGEAAFEWAENALRSFHAKFGMELFREARSLGGNKLVLGGSSRFKQSQFDSVRKSVLYADTILIPDPIMPWLEAPRREERFRHVLFLEAVFVLLHLKPLVDADLPYPAVVVFPSWEKLLEEHDPLTKQAIPQLVTDIIAFHGRVEISTFEELKRFATEHQDKFLQIVDDHNLLVAPGGELGEPLTKAIERYRTEMKSWRSDNHVAQLNSLPTPLFVLNGILERIAPQFHLLENAEKLRSHPMLCLPAHWHYFELCATVFQSRLKSLSLLGEDTIATIRSLNQPKLNWLGNVPIEALVELRKNNENEDFRRHLCNYVQRLKGSSLENTDAVTGEVVRGIATLLAEHQRRLKQIERKYQRLHMQTAGAAWVTAAAALVPALAPFLGAVVPLAAIGKYAHDKVAEFRENKEASRSVMGVLSAAQTRAGSPRK